MCCSMLLTFLRTVLEPSPLYITYAQNNVHFLIKDIHQGLCFTIADDHKSGLSSSFLCSDCLYNCFHLWRWKTFAAFEDVINHTASTPSCKSLRYTRYKLNFVLVWPKFHVKAKRGRLLPYFPWASHFIHVQICCEPLVDLVDFGLVWWGSDIS